jgi:hypothetical protein
VRPFTDAIAVLAVLAEPLAETSPAATRSPSVTIAILIRERTSGRT